MLHPARDLGGHIDVPFGGASATAGAPILVVAGGAGDNVKVDGAIIDREKAGSGLADSCVVASGFLATLGDGDTLSLTVELEHADDLAFTSPVAEEIKATAVVATGGSGGTNESGVDQISVNLRGKKRFVRFNHTPDFSAGAADTGFVMVLPSMGGYDQLPA